MIRNLASYRIGHQLLMRRDDWEKDRVADVKLLSKAKRQIKVRALSDDWWRYNSIHWLSTEEWTILQVIHDAGE